MSAQRSRNVWSEKFFKRDSETPLFVATLNGNPLYSLMLVGTSHIKLHINKWKPPTTRFYKLSPCLPTKKNKLFLMRATCSCISPLLICSCKGYLERSTCHVLYRYIYYAPIFVRLSLSLNPNITLCTLLSVILGGFLVADTVNDVTCNSDVRGASLKRFVLCFLLGISPASEV